MSVAVIRYLLAHDSGVVAQVPASRVFAAELPQNITLPAIVVRQVSGTEGLTAAMTETRMRTDRVQVSVLASSYASVKTILELVRTSCATRGGTVNGVKLDSILPDGVGPDIYDSEARIFEQSRDFIVKHF